MAGTPADRKYTKTHEWIKIDGEEALIGITDYAQGELGEVVFVETPEINSFVEQGTRLGVIESIKSVSEIYAPLSGMITEVNNSLTENPHLVNQSPYDKGWVLKMKVEGKESLAEEDSLLDAEEYIGETGGTTA